MLHSEMNKWRTAGISVVELLVGVGIMGIVAAGLSTYITNFERFRNNMALVSARDSIARRIQQQIQAFDNIQFSALDESNPGNRMLRACLDPGGEVCQVSSAERQVEFRLLLNQGASGASGRRAIAGPAASGTKPVLYSKNGGDNCAADQKDCGTFEAHAYFWGVCKGGAAECPQASTIFVRYQVRANVSGVFSTKIQHAPPDPDFSADKASFALSFPVSRGLLAAQSCPDFAQQAGYDSAGRLLCKCLLGYEPKGTDADGQIICQQSAQCLPGQIVVGMLATGIPDCRTPEVRCADVKFGKTVDKTARCPAGGWLEDLDLGTCRAGPKTKKASNREIACDNNAGRCCWYETP